MPAGPDGCCLPAGVGCLACVAATAPRAEPHPEGEPAWQSPRVFRRPPAVEAVRSWCAQGGATPRRLNGRDFGRVNPGTEKVACGAADEPPASGGVDGAVAPGNGIEHGPHPPPSAVFA